MTRAVTTLWLGVAILPAVSLMAAAATKPLTAEQQLELKTLTGQLSDPSRSAKTKAEAAALLLTRSYPAATEALKSFLADSTNRAAQIAVADAIAGRGVEEPTFIEPLMAMLTGGEPTVRVPAARALVIYKNHGVIEKLIAIARDAKVDKAVRLVAISGLQRVLNKQAVDALVYLVAERDTAIRTAAAESLAKLTNIRAFGTNSRKWQRWWRQSKDKPASEWLADLAESLAREKARLEDQDAVLRQRLAAAMMDLYAATAATQRDKLLLGFLKDSLADVRLVGVTLADRRAAGGKALAAELRTQVRAMLADEDIPVRRAVALLTANLGDPKAVAELLARLKVEQAPEVKQGLLTALGQFRDANALGPILAEVMSKDEPVAAAAAAALARSAGAKPLEGTIRADAVQTLLGRYGDTTAAPDGDGAALREALLTAMGMVADAKFIPSFRTALTDPAATVRLAAVKGMTQLRRPELADTLAPLAGDEDRGVRQAAIDALGALGSDKHRQILLQRTDPASEPDAAVRVKAWGVVMAVLAKSDAATLAEVCKSLAERKDAVTERIRLRQMLVAALKADKSSDLPAAQRELAAALSKAERPAEAVPLLAEAYAAHAAAKDPLAVEVWGEWIDAMLAANDPAVIKAMADPARSAEFAKAYQKLTDRLKALADGKRHAPIILLAGEAARQLTGRLATAQQQDLAMKVAAAESGRLEADRKRVADLSGRLLAAEESARKSAADELKAMGDRAVAPLLTELRRIAAEPAPNPKAEKAILDVLTQVAPKLTGYDPRAPQAERLAKIDAWLKVL